jgi:predicted ATPase
LVFEDLHWIDSESQALLDGLSESVPTARMLLLVNYRPEYEHRWGGKTYYTQVRIDPLQSRSAEELLDSLLGPDPRLQTLKERLIERTEGNPFFFEESVRALVETRALVADGKGYRLTGDVTVIQVAATVQAILAARIDRLPPEEKQLLQAAAVIGKDVPFPLLRAISDLPEEALQRGITLLQAAEFFYETAMFPDLEFTFKHALTHEVAYGSLLNERRREVHVRIVGAIEASYPDRLAEHGERLAHHAFRGEAWAKALIYLRQAGAKAISRAPIGRRWRTWIRHSSPCSTSHRATTRSSRRSMCGATFAMHTWYSVNTIEWLSTSAPPRRWRRHLAIGSGSLESWPTQAATSSLRESTAERSTAPSAAWPWPLVWTTSGSKRT